MSAISRGKGFERGGRAEFHQFLVIAKGSCGEVRSQLYIAHDIGYLDAKVFEKLKADTEELSRILAGLRKRVERQKETQK